MFFINNYSRRTILRDPIPRCLRARHRRVGPRRQRGQIDSAVDHQYVPAGIVRDSGLIAPGRAILVGEEQRLLHPIPTPQLQRFINWLTLFGTTIHQGDLL